MATRIWAINPGESSTSVRENVGPTNTSAIISVQVDLDTTRITDQGATRGPDLKEVIHALEEIKEHMLRGDWPSA